MEKQTNNMHDLINLSILVPSSLFTQTQVRKLKGESPAGEFCLKPRHIDLVTPLVPGIFSYVETNDRERFLALDQGVLIKQGADVRIAARRAVPGPLGSLAEEVERMLQETDEQERQIRSAMARLEIGFLKRFMDFSHRS